MEIIISPHPSDSDRNNTKYVYLLDLILSNRLHHRFISIFSTCLTCVCLTRSNVAQIFPSEMKRRFKATEICLFRRMLRITQTEHVSDEEQKVDSYLESEKMGVITMTHNEERYIRTIGTLQNILKRESMK